MAHDSLDADVAATHPSGASTWRSARLWIGAALGFCGALLGGLLMLMWLPTVGSASALGTLSAANTVKVESVDITPTGAVRANSLANGADLDGKATDYDGGGGYGSDDGPTWNTLRAGVDVTGVWMAPSNSNVARNDAGPDTRSVALLPWMSHKSKIQNDATDFGSATDIGYVLGTDSSGTATGVATRIYWDGSVWRLQLIDVGTGTQCGSDNASLGNTSGRTYSTDFTYNPTAGTASATVTRSGGGAVSASATCSPVDVSGRYAGLVSYRKSATVYRMPATAGTTPTLAYQ